MIGAESEGGQHFDRLPLFPKKSESDRPEGHYFCGPSCRGMAGSANPGDTGMDEGIAGPDSVEQMLIGCNYKQVQKAAFYAQLAQNEAQQQNNGQSQHGLRNEKLNQRNQHSEYWQTFKVPTASV